MGSSGTRIKPGGEGKATRRRPVLTAAADGKARRSPATGLSKALAWLVVVTDRDILGHRRDVMEDGIRWRLRQGFGAEARWRGGGLYSSVSEDDVVEQLQQSSLGTVQGRQRRGAGTRALRGARRRSGCVGLPTRGGVEGIEERARGSAVLAFLGAGNVRAWVVAVAGGREGVGEKRGQPRVRRGAGWGLDGSGWALGRPQMGC
ncbi:hypothetical protein TRIUR3_31174 [Triticum urartu]|uniref:Uncharacterized protein n=1 Tax=Triticum urartu TaxID=4572 RepID=M8AA01_TRIUA|nr:hypothetical protein TRIUR3_31174 [Triticum urartu]